MFHWPFTPQPKPAPQPVRFYAATKRENEAARRRRTETHLLLAVENAVNPRDYLPVPAAVKEERGR